MRRRMSERIACMIWCEECFGSNWSDVIEWVWSGRAVSRGGVLKVPLRCGSCDAELAPGERVETVTLHSGLMEAAAWAAEFVLFSGVNDDGRGDGTEGV